MPLSAAQLRALETALRQEAEATLRARGWDGHLALVRNPYGDELALRLEGTARIGHQSFINERALEVAAEGSFAHDVVRGQLLHDLRRFPALPGSAAEPEAREAERRRVLEELGVTVVRNVDELPPEVRPRPRPIEQASPAGRALSAAALGAIAGATYGLDFPDVEYTFSNNVFLATGANLVNAASTPQHEEPALPGPEPKSRYELLMGEDVI